MQKNEDLRMLLAEETKKYERMLRDFNASVKNLTEAELGARRQGGKLEHINEKVTSDSIKKSIKIEDSRGKNRLLDIRNQGRDERKTPIQ